MVRKNLIILLKFMITLIMAMFALLSVVLFACSLYFGIDAEVLKVSLESGILAYLSYAGLKLIDGTNNGPQKIKPKRKAV
ncbi:MAG: hypothetical protein V1867_07700 [Candidatus Falkowbacteria bacterium]